jgi:mRNA-degrading endonuclease toxin of MazEF toxin-antitoxin module
VPAFRRGEIVLAEVTDPQGQNRKPRPLIILTPTEEIREGERFVGVAVSSTFPRLIPDDSVELPYHPAGQARTGLRKPSVAVCSWRVPLTHADVIRSIGWVPDKQMLVILEKVKRLTSPTPPATQRD